MHPENEVGQYDKVFELMVDGNRHSRTVFHDKLTGTLKCFVLRAFNIHLDEGDPLARKDIIECYSLYLLDAFEVPLLCFFLADDARSLKSICSKIHLLINICGSIRVKIAFAERRKDLPGSGIILRIGFEGINVVKTFGAAPACEVVAGSSVKTAAVHKDLVLARFEKIEVLALIIAPVEDSPDDILLAYSDITNKTLSDLISYRLYRIRDN